MVLPQLVLLGRLLAGLLLARFFLGLVALFLLFFLELARLLGLVFLSLFALELVFLGLFFGQLFFRGFFLGEFVGLLGQRLLFFFFAPLFVLPV